MTTSSPKSNTHTPGPWYVRDFRTVEMRRLGWNGPSIDRILITNKTGPEIEACGGHDSVVARIQFDNRTGELGEHNLADAHLIAAAPEMLEALKALIRFCNESTDYEAQHPDKYEPYINAMAVIAKATGATR